MEHQGMVREIAGRFVGRGLDRDDLIQEGQIALLLACERFDPGRGCAFSTLAYKAIRRSMVEALKAERTIVIPHDVWVDSRRARDGRVRTDEERRGRMAYRDEVIRRTRVVRDRGVLFAGLEDRRGPGPDVGATVPPGVAAALAALEPAVRCLVAERYGLDGGGGASAAELAARHGMTRHRVAAVMSNALRRLKVHLDGADRADRTPRPRYRRLSDAEIRARVLDGLARAPRPATVRRLCQEHIRNGSKLGNGRVRAMLDRLVAEGRAGRTGGAFPMYTLA